ncbi:unnamed protein product [Prunus brigantina]
MGRHGIGRNMYDYLALAAGPPLPTNGHQCVDFLALVRMFRCS